MLTADEISEVLQAGHELRAFEIKGPGERNDGHLFAKVTKAALSMANHRDGGHVIIGINDNQTAAMLPGLTASQVASWLAYDDVSRKLAEYADPPLRLRPPPENWRPRPRWSCCKSLSSMTFPSSVAATSRRSCAGCLLCPFAQGSGDGGESDGG